ncbi:MAG TPA: UpxY family transcription antiterminator [Bacteroidales bacterium]|nr:UpxY family transcription antiterminator [Bacteroidales bacterium]
MKKSMEQREINNKSVKENKWYAVYTRPRAEKQVNQRLMDARIETFLPLQKTLRQWSDRRKMVEKPLLSSYIFVKTQPKFFPVVYKTVGVVRIITFEGQAVAIPEYQINNLRLIINSDAKVEVTTEKLAKGDIVEVTTGSLKGLIGELIKINSRKRVVIRLDRIDQNIVLTIPAAFLKKVRKNSILT